MRQREKKNTHKRTQGWTDILIGILERLGLDWKTETRKKMKTLNACSTMRRSFGRWQTWFDNIGFRTLAAS